MKKIWLVLSLAAFLPTFAGATAWHSNDTFMVKFHFSTKYFGQDVVGVYAHVGVLMSPSSCGNGSRQDTWDNVQHVKLTKKGDHFWGKAVLKTTGSECQPRLKGPIVQYWVYLKGKGDKATQTRATMIPFRRTTANPSTGGDQTKALVDKFNRETKDATKTEAFNFSWGWAN